MAAIITIPIDAHLITLCIESFEVVSRTIQVGRSTQTQRERVRSVREVGPRLDATGLDHAISTVNQVWTPADIVFNLRSTDFPRVNAPGNNEEVNEAGFFQLASQFPARRGVSALFVSRFASRDLGGQAAEALGCCIVAFHGEQLTGKTLAHELGHLL
ncbi:MAG TPA: hypothetical protein VGQ19_17665, partial [Burkholderiales bacterium]|nr:hypothetical protein [Burkholderiales bacterium]